MLKKSVCLFAAFLLHGGIVHSQNRDKYDSIAARYKDYDAVYTNMTEQLEISEEDGELKAESHVVLEKLLLSDRSLNTCNSDYFSYSDFQRLTDYNGVAYVPENGKTYKKTTYVSYGEGVPRSFVFYADNRVAVAYYSSLRKNSITETKYSIWHRDLHMLSAFDFYDYNHNLPIDKATFEITAPNYVNLNFILKGENTGIIQQTKEEKNGKMIYRFTATNILPSKSIGNVPSLLYAIPHVIPYIKSYRLVGAKKDSNWLRNTDDLYKYLYGYVRNMNMKEDSLITKTVKEITKNDATARDKAAHIYKWVQDNLHYIAFEKGLEGWKPREASLVYKRKYGDCKDMTSILVAMYRKAGLDAYFTWIGTDILPYTNEETPIPFVNNHMICALKLGNEWVFPDATSSINPFGVNREDIQGKEAMIAIDENTYKIVTIPVVAADKNTITDVTTLTMNEGKITGFTKVSYAGYPAWEMAQLNKYVRKDDEKEKAIKARIGRGSAKFMLAKYDLETLETGNKDATLKATFAVDDYVQQVGKKSYVNMNVLHTMEDMWIDADKRNVAYYTDYKQKKKEVVELEIPKGYKVAYLPASAKGGVDGLWNYTITYKADANKITLTKVYEFNTLAVTPAQFAANNKMVEELKKQYKESVALTTK